MAKHKYGGDQPMFDVPKGVRSGVRRPNPHVRTTREAKKLAVPKAPQVSMARDWADSETALAEETGTLSPFIAEAIRRARSGDDSMLLPYQPTPSINPPRPRTLAAGYDPDTKTMRVRFRDGAGYEYYNVTPQMWRNFKRVRSPGRAITRYFPPGVANYARADW